jgi:hypothetical protein
MLLVHTFEKDCFSATHSHFIFTCNETAEPELTARLSYVIVFMYLFPILSDFLFSSSLGLTQFVIQ